jgi:hypothetical protein
MPYSTKAATMKHLVRDMAYKSPRWGLVSVLGKIIQGMRGSQSTGATLTRKPSAQL